MESLLQILFDWYKCNLPGCSLQEDFPIEENVPEEHDFPAPIEIPNKIARL